MDPLRLIQVGLGGWGSSWLQVVEKSPDWELVAIVDGDPAALARVHAARAARFETLTAALSATPADAALVTVPPNAHAQVALEALEAGLHCLVEKPLAPSLAEAEALVESAERAGRRLMAGQNFRFTPGAVTLRRLVAHGAVGRVEEAHVSCFRTPLLTGFRLELDEPFLLDMAIHHFDLVRFVLGAEPVRVTMSSSNPSWSPFRGNASSSGRLELEDGIAVVYAGSWAPRGPETTWEGTWSIHCEAGWLRWRDGKVLHAPPGVTLERTLKRRIRRRPLPQPIPLDPVAHRERAGLLAELAAAIREDREPEPSGRDNLHTLAVTFAAIESARSGEPVDVRLALGVG